MGFFRLWAKNLDFFLPRNTFWIYNTFKGEKRLWVIKTLVPPHPNGDVNSSESCGTSSPRLSMMTDPSIISWRPDMEHSTFMRLVKNHTQTKLWSVVTMITPRASWAKPSTCLGAVGNRRQTACRGGLSSDAIHTGGRAPSSLTPTHGYLINTPAYMLLLVENCKASPAPQIWYCRKYD